MSGARDMQHSPAALALKVSSKALIGAAGGGDGAAATVGARQQRMSDCGNRNTADFLRIDEAAALEDVTMGQAGWPHVTRMLARRQGFVLVPEPQAAVDPDGLLPSVAEITMELGDVVRAITEALRDGAWDEPEIDHAILQLEELNSASGRLGLQLKSIKAGLTAKREMRS